MYLCMSCVDMCTCVKVLLEREALNAIGLEQWAVVSNLTWMLGHQTGLPARAVHALHHWAIFLAPEVLYVNKSNIKVKRECPGTGGAHL